MQKQFIDHVILFERVLTYAKMGQAILLQGGASVGKSTLVELIANRLGKSLFTKICRTDLATEELLGYKEPFPGENHGLEFRWVDGELAKAVRNQNATFVLDEIHTASGCVQDILHPMFDRRKKLFLGNGNEPLVLDKGFWFVGTCLSVEALDFDFRSRFRVLTLGRLGTKQEKELLCSRFNGLTDEQAERMVRLSDVCLEGGILNPPVTRQLLAIAENLSWGLGFEESVQDCLLGPSVTADHERRVLAEAFKAEGLNTFDLADVSVREQKVESFDDNEFMDSYEQTDAVQSQWQE